MKKRIKLMKKHFRKNKGKPSEQVTEFINSDIEKAVERAKTFMGNKKVSKPIVLRAANIDDSNLKYRLSKHKNEDEFNVEYNNTLLTIIFLGEKDLNYYQMVINHENGQVGDDVVGVVKYEDISNTELAVNNTTMDKQKTLSTVTFDMYLRSNGTLSFDLRKHYMYKDEKYLNALTEKEQYIVDTLTKAINTN